MHFNRDFAREYRLSELGFEPETFWISYSLRNNTFLKGISISLINLFAPVGSKHSWGLGEFPKTTTLSRVDAQLVSFTAQCHKDHLRQSFFE